MTKKLHVTDKTKQLRARKRKKVMKWGSVIITNEGELCIRNTVI